jgi:hypothetical protein
VDRTSWPGGEIMRDVTRGGLAGLVVGIVVAGFGGRLAMRLAALVVPSANGAFTENGNRIGEITLAGSAALVIFAGLAAAIFLAVVWVAISPWLPGRRPVRGLVAMPIAVAFGATALINADNPDFVVLGHDPFVVAILLALVAAMAPAMAVADGWFDRRLPHAASITSPAGRRSAWRSVRSWSSSRSRAGSRSRSASPSSPPAFSPSGGGCNGWAGPRLRLTACGSPVGRSWWPAPAWATRPSRPSSPARSASADRRGAVTRDPGPC